MYPDVKSFEKYQATFHQSSWSFADYYLSFAQVQRDNFEDLDLEYPNFLALRTWLTHQQNESSAQMVIALIKALTNYLQRPEFATELLHFCQSGLEACQLLESNSGWVLLLRYEAYSFLGEWDKALTDAQTAISITEDIDPINHAQAMLALGRLEFNRGDYQVALNTLAKAESLLLEVGDLGGVATVRAELAAYYLNRSELNQALTLYLEVDKLRRQITPTAPSDHTLLMLGVVHRKKQEYEQAADYLLQLLHRGKDQQNPGVIATASHHLAWLHVDQKNISEAFRLASQARQLYLEVCDPRGLSDVDEQLGLIALMKGDLDVAESYLQASLNVRQHLGNQQGVASSLRHLSILYIRKGNIWLSLQCLYRSYLIYQRLGVLSRQRILTMAKQFWQLTVMER